MSSSASSSNGSSGGAVKVSGGGGSISALFSSSDAGTSLGGVSTSAGSPILLNGSPEAEQPVAEAVEQVVTSEESGDVISIDVHNEGEQANLPEVQGYEWAPYETRTHVMRFRWGNDLGDLVERTKVFDDEVEDGFLRVKHFYTTRSTTSKGWVSFLGANKSLFTLYSYKGFKTGFFKVAIPGRGRKYIFDEEDIMARTTLSNAEFMARAKSRRREDDPAEEVAPLQSVPAALSTGPSPVTTVPTGASGVVTRPRFIVKPPGSTIPVAAADKGKKTKRDDSSTGRSSKKSTKVEASGSLATAFLSGEVWLDEEVSFHLGSRVKDMLRDVSEEEALPTAGELTLKLAGIYTKFPWADRSRIESLEKELVAAKVELQEVKAFASDLKTQFDRLNGIKAEHAKCDGLFKAADDRAKEEQQKAKEAHLAAAESAADWKKKAKEYQAELRVADEQVFAQYETSFQNAVDHAVFFYHYSPDRFDVHLGVVDGKLERVFDQLDEATAPPADNS
ncbi:hypothetical protein DEO72_LG8g1260 [Vigna unguiculata]|uniref:Uncharacterized protein n=1 Tax=Vigna unguiculata TaxID=3917 RepID=A0A4D6MP87_VIGUN|nr:hypothetical protein DEO72_LG8g1260 [Vigna unguiculata]